MKWISVNERLPENNQPVLCFDNERKMFFCIYDNQEFYYLNQVVDVNIIEPNTREKYITHWMPLPPKPDDSQE